MSTVVRDRNDSGYALTPAIPDPDQAARERTAIQQKIRKAEAAGAAADALVLAEAGLATHSGDIGLTLAAARQECSLGQYGAGRDRLDAALKIDGLAPELLAFRARIAHYEGKQELALALLQKAELNDPFGIAASVLQTRVLVALDRPKDAWAVLSDTARFRPHALPVLFNLARLVDDQTQLDAFYRIWLKARDDDAAFANAVRPLITACLRARDFDRAAAALRRAITIVLGSDGAVRPKVRDRALGRDGRRALVDVVTRLQAHGVPHFLCAGTCLGAIREGKLLSFDNDIDIGIYEEDFDRGRLVEVFREDTNFRVQEIDRINPKVGLQHWNGVALDLFKFYREDGKVWHNGTFTRWWNTPFDLAPIKLYGMTMSVPAQSELYLEECYGDWRTPKPTFDAFFEGPNAVNKWSEYFQIYLLRKVFEVISRGDLELAKHYTDRFPDPFAGLDLSALDAPASTVTPTETETANQPT